MKPDYYKSLLESFDSIIVHLNNNKIVYHHIGIRETDLISASVNSDNPEDFFDNEFYSVLKEKLKLEDKFQQFDFELKSSGEPFWFEVKIHQSEKEEFLIILQDITERKSKEENFRLIFENAVMGIYKSTPGGGRHLSVNPELARIYGYENTDDLLESITNISNQLYVDKDRRKELLKGLHNENSNFGFESQLYRKDGQLIWISENAKAVKDAEGNVKFIVGTVKDITERKIAEEKIRQAKEDWERTFDSIDNIVVILDKSLKIRQMNKAAERNMVSENRDLELKSCVELFNCNETECLNCPARKTIIDHRAHSEEIENLYQGKTYHTTSSPIFDDAGKLQGIVFIAKDITEEKKLRQQAEYRLQQVIQTDKLKSLGEVVAGVAHEINNPNAYITTNLGILEESWRDLKPVVMQAFEKDINLAHSKDYYLDIIEETPEIISSIKDGSRRIKNVVGNLKDFARINSAGQKSDININEVVEKGLKIIGANVRRLVKTINLDLAEDLPLIKGHFQKLEQVLINLVLNSSQAITDKAVGKIDITTRFIKRLKCIVVQVRDNGPGIDEELIPKLFDPFFTTRRDIGGSGLGLSISYEIIQEHNGIIGVHSKKGIGSKFALYLPVENEKPDLSPKILCIDDGEYVHNMLKIAFLEETDKFFGFISEAALIVDYLADHPEIDVIMMNIKYGKFSFELIKKIREIDPLIEIIFYSDAEFSGKEEKLPCDHEMYPFNIDKLREILNSAVRQKL